jgi:phage terminase large subunit-like protein
LWQDPAQAGKDQVETLTKALREAYPAADLRWKPASENKIAYASILSALCDPAVRKHPAYLVRGPWNEQLLTAMTIFPNKRLGKIDLIDAASRAGLEVSKLTTSFASAFMAGLGRQG